MRTLLALLVAVTAPLLEGSIITRHDTPDAAYVACADTLSVADAVLRYNATDVAGTLVIAT